MQYIERKDALICPPLTATARIAQFSLKKGSSSKGVPRCCPF
jgi:hypothetical protein